MKAWDLFCVHCTTTVAVDAAAAAIDAAATINIAAAAFAAGSKARSHSRQFDGSFLIKADSLLFSLPKYMIQDHSTITARIFIATYIVDIMFGKSKTIKIFRS